MLSDEEKSDAVIELASIGLPVKMIAKLLGISSTTLYKNYQDELELGKSKACAEVAQQLFNLATNWNGKGDVPHAVQFQAAKYWATTQMGWSEAAHITVEHQNVPVNIHFVTPELKQLYGKEGRLSPDGQTTQTNQTGTSYQSKKEDCSDEPKQVQDFSPESLQPTFIRH